MKIQPTQKNNTTFDYVKTAAIGAAAGYGLKYALPLTTNEEVDTFTKIANTDIINTKENAKNEKFNNIIKKIANSELDIDKSAIEILENNKKEILNADIEKLVKNTEGIEYSLQQKILNVARCVEEAGLKSAEKAKNALKMVAKHSRSTFYFMSIGAIVGLSYQVLKQSLTPTLEFIPSNERMYF